MSDNLYRCECCDWVTDDEDDLDNCPICRAIHCEPKEQPRYTEPTDWEVWTACETIKKG